MKTPNEKLAERFAEEHNGKIVGLTYGYLFRTLKAGETTRERSHAGVKILIDGHMIHHYTITTWFRKKEGISISVEQLQVALDENALILHDYLGTPYVVNAQSWELWAKRDDGYFIHPRFHKPEVSCLKKAHRVLDISKLEEYYDDYVPNKN